MEENIITIESKADNRFEAFTNFMSDVECSMNELAITNSFLFKNCNALQLEEKVVHIMKDVAPRSSFNPEDINLISGQRFPDILLSEDIFGVEVKSTQSNHWTSTGSSIVESTRNANVKHIYMLFGKLGGSPIEFKCKPYEDCLYDIAVTHSPRYLIDMNIKKEDTIFSKMKTSYDELRTSPNSIEQVRNYYRDKAIKEHKSEMPWWLEKDDDKSSQMNVRLWQDAKTDILKAKMFVLFPEVLNSDFANVALWLCTMHSIVVYNARDAFTAGGQCTKVGNQKLQFPIPHIIGSLLNSAKFIKQVFQDEAFITQELFFYRKDLFLSNNSLYSNWINSTNHQIQLIKDTKTGKTIADKGYIPFIDWFANELKAEFGNHTQC